MLTSLQPITAHPEVLGEGRGVQVRMVAKNVLTK